MGIVRTLLALSVVLFHTGYSFVFVGGRNAVQMFYMVSGFLISHVLLTTPAYRDPTTFWRNRALRLYPAYFVVAALTLVAYVAIAPGFWRSFSELPAASRAFMAVVNVTLLGLDWPQFFGDGHLAGAVLIPQAWTLGVEMSFYVLAPFVVRRVPVLLALFALSIAGRLVAIMAGFGLDGAWTYRFFPFELALFVAGALSRQILLPRVERILSDRSSAPTMTTAACVLMCAIYPIIPLPEAARAVLLLAMFFAALPFLFAFQRRTRWDRSIGDLSYPLYIGHLLALLTVTYMVKRFGLIGPASISPRALAVGAALAFAVAVKLAVTDPVERWRRQVRAGPRRIAAPVPAP